MAHSIVLAETALELIPKELQLEPGIVREGKNAGKLPGELLLDASRNLSVMKKAKLADYERRGRPDILHFCSMLALDSRLNAEGGVEFIAHTRNDEVIRFSPRVRLPRAYNRFCGLMQDLLKKKRITDGEGNELLAVEKKTLGELLSEQAKSRAVYVLEAEGERTGLRKLSALAAKGDSCFVIGGFPHGGFSSPAVSRFTRISLSKSVLCAWAVVCDVLAACELAGEAE